MIVCQFVSFIGTFYKNNLNICEHLMLRVLDIMIIYIKYIFHV